MDDRARGRRLFVAVPLPVDLEGYVAIAQQSLPALPGLRLLRRDQLHVTLAFIGEVDEVKASAARSVVEKVPADMGGEGRIGGLMPMPSAKRARVVALGIADEGGALGRLYEHIMRGLEEARVTRREKRPFKPHLTVARLRTPAPVQPTSESGHAPFAIESVCLFESELRREGAVYTSLARRALSRGDARETA